MSAWLAEALFASALLIAAVLVLRAPVRRGFGPRVAYALWALPALRLALPPLPAWPAAATPVTLGRETIVILVSAPQSVAPALTPAFPVAEVLTGLWAAGAAAFLLHHAIRHRRFVRAVLTRGETLGETGGIRLVVSDAAPGPLAFGVWRRTVAVPRDFATRYDAEERALALEHEVGHHRRGDLLANWIGLVVLACHWFNPLAWAAWRAFRSDQELANDAHVLARHDATVRHAYGSAIVKSVRGHADYLALPSTCHLHSISDLKGRLSMLTRSPASRRRLAAGGVAVSVLAAAGLVATASGTSATAAVSDGIAATGAALAAQAAPPAPPAPLAPTAGRRHVHRIVVSRDGETKTYEGAEADAYLATHPLPAPPVPPVPPVPSVPPIPPAPAAAVVTRDGRVVAERTFVVPDVASIVARAPSVYSQTCDRGSADRGKPDRSKEVVVHTTRDGKSVMIVCTDRIDRMAREATQLASNSADIERNALASARDALRSSRAAIEADRAMTDADKAQALAGLKQAQAELDADMARD